MIRQLLGDMPAAMFFERVFLRQPFSSPQTASALMELGTWTTVECLVATDGADVMVVRDGKRVDAPASLTARDARVLFNDGCTLLVRHAERHDEGLRTLADEFAVDFAAPVDIHLYCTPASQHGFGWHYDAEDVFIIQTAGQKEYSLRKNTVNPWPLVETLPADMKFEREHSPLMNCLLAPGDWLYIPHGYWHVARAPQDAISLAVGVLSPSALDLFDFARGRLLESLRWRQRLPVAGRAAPHTPGESLEQYRQLAAALTADLSHLVSDEAFLRSYLIRRGIDFDAE